MKVSTPLLALSSFENTPVFTETRILEINLPVNKSTNGDKMDTNKNLDNLKRSAPESTCLLSPLYTTFTPPLPELDEETSALNIHNMINRTKKKLKIISRDQTPHRETLIN